MDNFFIVFDSLNSVAFQCYSLLRFNYNNDDYLIYYVSENDSNCKIYASKLFTNSSGICSLVDISNAEKNMLNDIIYKIIISFPSSYNKNVDIDEFVNNFSYSNNIVFSKNIPNLSEQVLCNNSFFANSDLKYISSVKSFYRYITSIINAHPSNSLIWSIPKLLNTDVIVDNNTNSGIVSSSVNDSCKAVQNTNENIPINITPISDESINQDKTFIGNNSFNHFVSDPFLNNNYNVMASNFNISYENNFDSLKKDNFSNEKLPISNNIVSTLQENAGFAINRYIIIGTVCFVLASIIVAIGIFFVNNL